jgi:hypothetical protein
MTVRLKQGCKICTQPTIVFPKSTVESLFAFAISIIIQPIFVNVIASLGERAAGFKKGKDVLLGSSPDIGALHSVSIRKILAETY